MFVLKNYGEEWRKGRRAFHQSFGPERVPHHYPVQIETTRRFLRSLAEGKTELGVLMKLYAPSLVR